MGSQLLSDLAGLVTSGEIRPIVDEVRPLADIAAAHRAMERGGRIGKQVLTIG